LHMAQLMPLPLLPLSLASVKSRLVFTARCYASAVLAMALCPSLCPSVRPTQVGVLLKRLKVGSHKQHHTIARRLEFSDAKDLREIPPRSPHAGAPNTGEVGQNRRLSTNSGYISKTVQDRRMVSVKVE